MEWIARFAAFMREYHEERPQEALGHEVWLRAASIAAEMLATSGKANSSAG